MVEQSPSVLASEEKSHHDRKQGHSAQVIREGNAVAPPGHRTAGKSRYVRHRTIGGSRYVVIDYPLATGQEDSCPTTRWSCCEKALLMQFHDGEEEYPTCLLTLPMIYG